MNNLLEHYNKLSSQFENCWYFSDEYVETNKRQIIDNLKLNKDDIFLDLGCGSGLYSKLIHNEIQFKNKIICVDFSSMMINQINGFECVKFQENIVNFSARNIKYNKILCKEVIHHLNKAERQTLFKNLYNNLEINGILLIIYFNQHTNLPLFENAIKMFARNVTEPDIIIKELVAIKFEVGFLKFTLPIKINKQKYYDSLRNRFISVLEHFTDREIENGIVELETKYYSTNKFVIDDNMISILATKLAH
jgi:cyclopropane fatty-acyl-phospholipid synthase-like methyltransferase